MGRLNIMCISFQTRRHRKGKHLQDRAVSRLESAINEEGLVLQLHLRATQECRSVLEGQRSLLRKINTEGWNAKGRLHLQQMGETVRQRCRHEVIKVVTLVGPLCMLECLYWGNGWIIVIIRGKQLKKPD